MGFGYYHDSAVEISLRPSDLTQNVLRFPDRRIKNGIHLVHVEDADLGLFHRFENIGTTRIDDDIVVDKKNPVVLLEQIKKLKLLEMRSSQIDLFLSDEFELGSDPVSVFADLGNGDLAHRLMLVADA